MTSWQFFLKKYFVNWEKGCNFAPLFAPKNGVTRRARKCKIIETVETRDSVCQMRIPTRDEARHSDESREVRRGEVENNSYNEEFDPGSGWTLAAGLTHASRGAAGGSNTLLATGARVRNAYATCPWQGDNPVKTGLIPRNAAGPHGPAAKD